MDFSVNSVSIEKYVQYLTESGANAYKDSAGTFWIGHEIGSIVRIPTFVTDTPSLPELKSLMWRNCIGLASYIIEPSKKHPSNTYLYVCHDQDYSLQKLPDTVGRNVRRAQHTLK